MGSNTGDRKYTAILDKAYTGNAIGVTDVATLLQPQSAHEEQQLFEVAHWKRMESVGSKVHLRGIIEFSNHCRQNCLYCGLRKDNTSLPRYRMSPAAIVDTALEAVSLHKFGTFVLQSGEDPGYPAELIAELIGQLKRNTEAAITLGVGEMEFKDYELWRKAGADRFLLKFETSDSVLFSRLKPTTTLPKRLRCLRSLRNLGYQVGSGIILGLPDQDFTSIACDLILARQLDIEMVSIGPFIPHPGTPLRAFRQPKPLEGIKNTLIATAVARLLMPFAHIPATTALGTISKDACGLVQSEQSLARQIPGIGKSLGYFDARALALTCGANVIMPDVTPMPYKKSYEIYPGKSELGGTGVSSTLTLAKNLVYSLGMEISPGKGDSPKPPWKGDPDIEFTSQP